MWLFRPPNVEALKAKGDIRGLTAALRYREDVDVRKSAAKALGELGDQKAVEALIKALEDEVNSVRLSVISALGLLKDERAIKPLIAILKNRKEHPSWQWEAAKSLAQIGTPALSPLVEALQHSDASVRLKAAASLGWIGDVAAIKALITALDDKDDVVRRNAGDALVKIGTASIKSLVAVMSGKQVEARRGAAVALEQLGWQPEIEKQVQIDLLTLRWDRAVEKGAAAVDPLIAALKDADPRVRGDAAKALGKLRDTRALVPLVERLKDSDVRVRASSALALGWLGDHQAVEPLIVVAANYAEDSSVRKEAIEALGQISDLKGVEILMEVLTDRAADLRRAAVESLKQIGDLRAVKPLIKRLENDEDTEVKKAVILALGSLGDRQAIEHLIQALANHDLWEAIKEALWQFEDAATDALVKALIDSNWRVRQESADLLEERRWQPENDAQRALLAGARKEWKEALSLGAAALEPLLIALNDEDWFERERAASALADFGYHQPPQALITALQKAAKDEHWAVREKAQKALEKLRKRSNL